MKLKAGLEILQQTKKAISRYAGNVADFKTHKWMTPINMRGVRLASQPVCDTVTLSKTVQQMKLKNFTFDEILDMKPTAFRSVLDKRTDIPKCIDKGILTPEKLMLFDEIVKLETFQRMTPAVKEKFLDELFSLYNLKTCEVSAQLEVIPNLIKKGYDPQMLAGLQICEYNKDIVENVLTRADLPEKYVMCKAQILGDEIQRYGANYLDELRHNAYRDALRYVDKNNFQYIDECLELTGGFECLPYWTKDSGKILRKFAPDIIGLQNELLDRLYRNGHDYTSVSAIFDDKQMSVVTQRLLEYKKFNKFKDIGIEEFDGLSIDDKKEFIRGYICALTPKEFLYRNQCHLESGLDELQNSMKIYRELNPKTTQTLINSYYDTLRSLLNKLPESERKAIGTSIDTKFYRRQYRLDNPIPSLVDELENVLKVETRTIGGKTVKYAQMNRDVDFGISAHRFPNAESILTIEALEEVDPNMLLCVGTKGGTRGVNIGKNGHALIVKPRKSTDWHVQACADIDSGNGATKNVYNFEHQMLPYMGNHCGAIDLIPNAIKNMLNLSQREYTSRMKALKNCRTLDEIGKKDLEMEIAIRKVIKEQNLYEGLMRTETMGVSIPENMPLEEVSEDIINYCIRRDIPLVRVIENLPKPKQTKNASFSIEM